MKTLAGVCLGVALGVFAADAVSADCEDKIRRMVDVEAAQKNMQSDMQRDMQR